MKQNQLKQQDKGLLNYASLILPIMVGVLFMIFWTPSDFSFKTLEEAGYNFTEEELSFMPNDDRSKIVLVHWAGKAGEKERVSKLPNYIPSFLGYKANEAFDALEQNPRRGGFSNLFQIAGVDVCVITATQSRFNMTKSTVLNHEYSHCLMQAKYGDGSEFLLTHRYDLGLLKKWTAQYGSQKLASEVDESLVEKSALAVHNEVFADISAHWLMRSKLSPLALDMTLKRAIKARAGVELSGRYQRKYPSAVPLEALRLMLKRNQLSDDLTEFEIYRVVLKEARKLGWLSEEALVFRYMPNEKSSLVDLREYGDKVVSKKYLATLRSLK
ncbi:hypothetical protein [Vibrio harveyi]|uniref:hypothetical protein n=1 Tax=Vibrio harveyi TaxID=669 RepID=UPI003CF1F954